MWNRAALGRSAVQRLGYPTAEYRVVRQPAPAADPGGVHCVEATTMDEGDWALPMLLCSGWFATAVSALCARFVPGRRWTRIRWTSVVGAVSALVYACSAVGGVYWRSTTLTKRSAVNASMV